MNSNEKESKNLTNWHSLSVALVFEHLNTGDEGLSKETAKERLLRDGPNALAEGKKKGVVQIFFDQFKSPLIYVLVVAASIVITLGDLTDGLIIFFVLFTNALVGTFQEGKARETLKSLKQFTAGSAVVLRDGLETQIVDEELVRGDVIILRDGDKVPADARLISLQGLKVNESSLTGESEPVNKDLEQKGENTPLPERRNMVYKGTLCVSGQAKAVVVETGLNTFVGNISEKLKDLDTEMPLRSKIKLLSKIIGFAVFVAVTLIIIAGFARGINIVDIFFTATAVSVSLIPEGLPVVITLILARGVYRMAKRNALIKNMQAIEALGQANVIAVDKTGTITKNELMVEKVYIDHKEFTVLGSGFSSRGNILFNNKIVEPINHPELIFAGKIATFCANASLEILEDEEIKVLGDPTEAALLVFGEKTGFKKAKLESEEPQVLDLPFGFKHKFHSTMHQTGAGFLLSVVGAPEAILAKVSLNWSQGREIILTKEDRHKIIERMEEFSALGLRVIAFAYHTSKTASVDIENMKDLVFGGLYGMADVLREEVAEAISEVKMNGIKTVMITGDFMGTAEAIAKQANIWNPGDKVITGSQIEGLSIEALSKMLGEVSVFARVLPEHKLSIVEAYKLRGDIIGMTGDGVNDALSLQAAHLGIAMGKGSTDVAKEAADIVLLDNNFKSIIAAIEEGRSIYTTIKKVVLYLISTSLGEFLSIAGAIFLGLALPLYPSQILWLNLVTDGFLVVAIGFEPNVSLKDAGRGTNIVTKTSAVRTFLMGTTMMIGTLLLFSSAYNVHNPKAWTLALSVLAVFQWFNAWNVRSEKRSVFHKPFSNPYLIAGLGAAIFCHLLAVYNPFMQKLLKTVPLGFHDWVVIISVASSIIFVEELRKVFVRFRK